MNWTGKAIVGIILLFIGANLFLQTLGIQLGGLIGLAISVLLVIYGYRKMKSDHGSNLLGMAILIFGLLLAIGHLHIFAGIFIAAIIIYFGYRLVTGEKTKRLVDQDQEVAAATSDATQKSKDAFDDEWNKFLEKNHLKS
ncbi:LiaF transmembrane domain-containing protein [Alkalihalobacterium sp. APHAB7]|uniref:LiaF transmembrane domain-containing protein n=1 Tax=Alkalihalobacterium sp. APHAB7 TaxID=3402081 RepID=UPI003AAD09CE